MSQQRFGSSGVSSPAEETSSFQGYPSGYRPRPIADQVARLQALFPGLASRYAPSVGSGAVPDGAEGYFAVPRWEGIAKTYGLALQRIFAAMATQRPCESYRNGRLELPFLRRREQDVSRFSRLAAAQEGQDILVIPAQLGLRHRGRSPRRARAFFAANEFGLGAYEVGIILLTHPERIVGRPDLWIDCAGDEYAQEPSNAALGIGTEYHGVPTWYAYELDRRTGKEMLEFMTSWFQRAFPCAGTASGFVP